MEHAGPRLSHIGDSYVRNTARYSTSYGPSFWTMLLKLANGQLGSYSSETCQLLVFQPNRFVMCAQSILKGEELKALGRFNLIILLPVITNPNISLCHIQLEVAQTLLSRTQRMFHVTWLGAAMTICRAWEQDTPRLCHRPVLFPNTSPPPRNPDFPKLAIQSGDLCKKQGDGPVPSRLHGMEKHCRSPEETWVHSQQRAKQKTWFLGLNHGHTFSSFFPSYYPHSWSSVSLSKESLHHESKSVM